MAVSGWLVGLWRTRASAPPRTTPTLLLVTASAALGVACGPSADDFEALQHDLDSLTAELGDLAESHARTNERYAEATESLAESQEDLRSLRHDLETTVEDLEEAESALNRARKDLKNLRKQLRSVEDSKSQATKTSSGSSASWQEELEAKLEQDRQVYEVVKKHAEQEEARRATEDAAIQQFLNPQLPQYDPRSEYQKQRDRESYLNSPAVRQAAERRRIEQALKKRQ